MHVPNEEVIEQTAVRCAQKQVKCQPYEIPMIVMTNAATWGNFADSRLANTKVIHA